NLVIGADNAALEDAPKAFNRVGVDGTHDIIARTVANNFMRIGAVQEAIAGVFIGREQADRVGNGFMHKAVQGLGVGVVDHASDDVALAAHCADDGDFASGAGTTTALWTAL